jgi:WD40 repeat protein/DNA-binding SARP family transcriptional activator
MKSTFNLRFLGPVQIEREGEPVRGFESRKALALLAYLAAEGQPVPRDRLVDLFWEDKSLAQGRNNLSWVLSRLSTFLPDCLQADRHTVAFLGESAESTYWLDLDVFEELEAQGDPLSLDAAVALFRGEFLEGLSLRGCPEFELWQVQEQERWRGRAAAALRELVAYHSGRGEVERGLRYARRLLQLEPWREQAHREVMRLLALDGQRGAALVQFETCRRLLDEELGVEPSQATEDLYRQIQAGDLEPPPLAVRPEPEPRPPAPGQPPYKGLAFFDVADSDLFFGREALTTRLVLRIRSAVEHGGEKRFLAIVGTSGSGKSSLVRAGLVAALQRGAPLADDTALPEDSHVWPVVIVTPTAAPLESLAVGLTGDTESVSAVATLTDDLARDSRSLRMHVRRTLSAHPSGGCLLLVVDQFEELFTQCRDPVQRTAFIDNLLTAAEGTTVVIITLRADFYHHCARFENLRQELEDRQIFIGPMTAQELRRAIEEPARTGGWDFEPGLVDLLLRDVGQEPGALPLLSHALLETWKRRQGHTLTLDGYTDAGGVRGAIARTAEVVYEQMDEGQQAIARDIFLRLTELGEAGGDLGPALYTRRRAALEELFPRPEATGAVETVLRTLVDARLITTERETVQVAHEALIREWPTLREWLEESRSDVRMQRLLAAAADEWERSGREPSYLLRGTRLAQFEGWADGTAVALTLDERAYLDTCLDERVQRQVAEQARRDRERRLERRAQQVLRGLMAVALAAAVISVGLTIWANGQRRRAKAAERDALVQASIGLASRAMLELDGSYPERSVLLALEALESYPYTWQAERALGQAVLGSRLRLLLQHVSAVNSAEWSSDGRRILSVTDTVAKVWDVSARLDTGANASAPTYGGELVTLSGHKDWVAMATWSPSEEYILTASTDGTAKVWDASASSQTYGECLLTLTGHADPVGVAAWSPSGEFVVGADWGGGVLVWDVASTLDAGLEPSAGAVPEASLKLSGHTDAVVWAAWSPDGSRIVTASDDGTARVWDLNAASRTYGGELLTLSGHTDRVEWAAWSPDGSRVVTASYDDTVRVWDVSAAVEAGVSIGAETLTLTSPGAGLIPYSGESRSATARAAWSPAGDYLATGGGDATAQIWDTSASSPTYGEKLYTLDGHTEQIQHLAWSADGSRLATSSMDGTARIWDAARGAGLATLSGHAAPVVKVAWSPAGDRLLTAGYDGAVKVWSPDPAMLTVSGLKNAEGCLVWSHGGDQVAMGLRDGSAKVWDVSAALDAGANTAEERLLLVDLDPTVGICPQAWSPSGDRLLTIGMGRASADPEVRARVWDATSGEELVALAGHTGDVWWAQWSPDGTRIATAGGADDTARVWDASASSPTYGEELLTFADHRAGVTNVSWSPDGQTIASSSFDASAKTWDAATGQVIRDLYPESHKMPVSAVSWSPDGDRIASFTYDGTGTIWDATSGAELVTLTGQTHEVWKMEWSRNGERIITYGADPTVRVWDTVSGAELLRYDMEGYAEADLSPDQTRIAANYAAEGLLRVFPAWQTLEELMDYARECCVVRGLTDQERESLGLPAQ